MEQYYDFIRDESLKYINSKYNILKCTKIHSSHSELERELDLDFIFDDNYPKLKIGFKKIYINNVDLKNFGVNMDTILVKKYDYNIDCHNVYTKTYKLDIHNRTTFIKETYFTGESGTSYSYVITEEGSKYDMYIESNDYFSTDKHNYIYTINKYGDIMDILFTKYEINSFNEKLIKMSKA